MLRLISQSLVFVVLLALPAHGRSEAAEQCWRETISIEGTVEMKEFRNQKNEKIFAYFLMVKEPFCYVGYDQENMKEVERRSGGPVQIWQMGAKAPASKFVGKQVQLEGKILVPQGSYAFAPIAVMEPQISERGDMAAISPSPPSVNSASSPRNDDERISYCNGMLAGSGITKRLGAYEDIDPDEPKMLFMTYQFAYANVLHKNREQPIKIDRARAFFNQAREASETMDDRTLRNAFSKCKRLAYQ